MKRILCAAVVATVAVAPMQARASALGALIAGGVVGGVVGSIYQSGPAVTANSVGAALAGAASAVPAAASGAAAMVAATSTPVLFGVAIGGATAYLLYSLAN
jgi:hypothetical protein